MQVLKRRWTPWNTQGQNSCRSPLRNQGFQKVHKIRVSHWAKNGRSCKPGMESPTWLGMSETKKRPSRQPQWHTQWSLTMMTTQKKTLVTREMSGSAKSDGGALLLSSLASSTSRNFAMYGFHGLFALFTLFHTEAFIRMERSVATVIIVKKISIIFFNPICSYLWGSNRVFN